MASYNKNGRARFAQRKRAKSSLQLGYPVALFNCEVNMGQALVLLAAGPLF